jgi:hypothetical protein
VYCAKKGSSRSLATLDHAARKFAFAGDPKLGLSMMKSAAGKYSAFVHHKRT